ncbi:Dabb family protein [Rhizobium mulingense]|uniref:Dabb family protein n=1 Tax=Rhizobium mulingense TaxID=3031128 RepID=UPI002B4A26D9|nr:Dabb family protein [Rhizobium sp. MJ21]MEB3045525.1 Dabb family protein [Rhizobium sp. MJ21]
MIRHIVFFTVQKEHLEAVRAGLSILTAIPHARLLEIGTNVKTDQLGTEIDLVVYGEFDDEAALAAYKAHPDYQRSIERVRPLREKRIAADYDSRAAVTRPL